MEPTLTTRENALTQEQVDVDRPWVWLAAGWNDLRRAPHVGLAYGFLIAGASWALIAALYVREMIYLLLPMTAGFFILAPLVAAGLYDTSRRLERGEHVDLRTAIGAWRAPGQLALMGGVLLLIHLAWIRFALLLFPIFFPVQGRGLPDLVHLLLFSPQSIPFLVVGTLVGAGFATLAFTLSAVSIPMLVDRRIGVVDAMVVSVATVLRNWKAMIFWAGLIVVFTAAGLATLFAGLVVVVPLVGHATWHAYRDLVPHR